MLTLIRIPSLMFCLLLAQICKGQRQRQPLHIILVVADDLGWKDVGFMGSHYYETPHLDRLAAKSTVFMHAYANASNCAPSRACLLSGSLTPRHGVYTVGTSERGNARDRKLIPTTNRTDLDTSFVTFAKMFQKAGFSTAAIGKWHLSDDPRQHGFDMHKGGGTAGNPSTYFSPYKLKYLTDGPNGEELTDRLTTEAVDFMADNRRKPFLLYLPYFAIHTPLQGKPALVEKYKKKEIRDGQGVNPHYSALVENMDANMGRIVKAIDSLKLENVLLVFTSDNGGIASLSRQWPLRAGKGSYYEGGIRVPLLIYEKKSRLPARRIDTPVQLVDLYPTLAELAGVKTPKSARLDGTSIMPILRGKADPELASRPLFFHFPIYLEAYRGVRDDSQDSLFRTRPGSALRAGHWKIIEYFENNEIELYDLENDPGERINLAGVEKGKCREMLSTLRQFQKQNNAPIPDKPNSSFTGSQH
jgi:arylsulfatase A-like enzyme